MADKVVDTRPASCRNRLRDEGKPHPRSGCNVCGDGGLRGCPHETKLIDTGEVYLPKEEPVPVAEATPRHLTIRVNHPTPAGRDDWVERQVFIDQDNLLALVDMLGLTPTPPPPPSKKTDFNALRLAVYREFVEGLGQFNGSQTLRFDDKGPTPRRATLSDCWLSHPDDMLRLQVKLKQINQLEDDLVG